MWTDIYGLPNSSCVFLRLTRRLTMPVTCPQRAVQRSVNVCYSDLDLVQSFQEQNVNERHIRTPLPWRFAKVVAGPGPFPLNCLLTQSSRDRVVMNVIDRSHNRSRREQIAVQSRAFLPKSKTRFSRPLADGQFFQRLAPVLDQDLFDLSKMVA